MVGAASLMLATPTFSLSWQHSVEHIAWLEHWTLQGQMLQLVDSAIKGSGAGMEPGEDARLVKGWWVSPGGLEVPELLLARSGATGGGWQLCADGSCQELGVDPGTPLRIAPCTPSLSEGEGQG